jgi:(p)ppGpp synthase/HD superfamily hydrolase
MREYMRSVDLTKGLAYAYHEGQAYDKHPYSFHLEGVVEKVYMLYLTQNSIPVGDDVCLVPLAYLHDILEDTILTEDELSAYISDEILEAVVAITRQKGEIRVDYLERVKKNRLALKVKVADTLFNLEYSVKKLDKKRIELYADQLLKLRG